MGDFPVIHVDFLHVLYSPQKLFVFFERKTPPGLHVRVNNVSPPHLIAFGLQSFLSIYVVYMHYFSPKQVVL